MEIPSPGAHRCFTHLVPVWFISVPCAACMLLSTWWSLYGTCPNAVWSFAAGCGAYVDVARLCGPLVCVGVGVVIRVCDVWLVGLHNPAVATMCVYCACTGVCWQRVVAALCSSSGVYVCCCWRLYRWARLCHCTLHIAAVSMACELPGVVGVGLGQRNSNQLLLANHLHALTGKGGLCA